MFHRSNRTDIQRLADLGGKRVAALAPDAFLGWLEAWREPKDEGLDPHRDFTELRFPRSGDAVH